MTTPLIARSDGRAGAGVIVNADERRAAAVGQLALCLAMSAQMSPVIYA